MKKRWLLISLCSVSCVVVAAQNVVVHKLKKNLEALTPAKHSILTQQQQAQATLNQLNKHDSAALPIAIYAYRPNYVLPFYFTGSPALNIYNGNIPDDQSLQNREFKFQVSFQVPVWQAMFGTRNTLKIAYTQQSYWQVYTRSPYFRETNYEPEIFIQNNSVKNWQFNVGFNHQSNGRGGDLERSWNRAYTDIRLSGDHWLISIKPWIMVFNAQSRDYHNPDIGSYIGHGRTVFVYKPNNNTLSLMLRNVFAHGGKRSTVELTWSYPMSKYFKSYVQFFSGYGQSLIEYKQHTNSIGVGLALNDYV